MKFKVGDKVKRISELDTKGKGWVKIGTKGEIMSVSSFETTYQYEVTWENGKSLPMNESEIELVKPNPKVPKKKLEEKKKLIIKEIKNNKDFLKQFKNVEKEVNGWDEEVIMKWK